MQLCAIRNGFHLYIFVLQFLFLHYVQSNMRGLGLSRTVPVSIPSGVTWDFFRGSFRQNHVPWGRLSLWIWVPGISPGVKVSGAFDWRPTALVMPKVEKIRGFNLPWTPRATSACRWIPLLLQSNMCSESFFKLNRPATEAACCTILHHDVRVLVSINSLFVT